MASFTLLRSGAWRVQVRRKGAYVAETFLRKTEAQDWAREAEIAIDRGLKPPRRGQTAPKKGQTTLGHLGIEDMDAARGAMLMLIKPKIKGHWDCFCGSGLRLRNCHGERLRSLHSAGTAQSAMRSLRRA